MPMFFFLNLSPPKILKLLIEYRANVNAMDQWQYTPLHEVKKIKHFHLNFHLSRPYFKFVLYSPARHRPPSKAKRKLRATCWSTALTLTSATARASARRTWSRTTSRISRFVKGIIMMKTIGINQNQMIFISLLLLFICEGFMKQNPLPFLSCRTC